MAITNAELAAELLDLFDSGLLTRSYVMEIAERLESRAVVPDLTDKQAHYVARNLNWFNGLALTYISEECRKRLSKIHNVVNAALSRGESK